MTAGDVQVIRGSLNSRKAVAFDGTDDELQIDAQTVGLQVLANSTGSFSLWILPDDITQTSGLYSHGANVGAAATNLLLEQVAGKIRLFGRIQATAGFDIITTSDVLTKRVWTHIAVVHNGTRPTIYINGEAVAMTDTAATDLTVWWSVLVDLDEGRIGCKTINNVESEFFDGCIGDVKYWTRDLSAAEVLEDYNGNTLTNDTTDLYSHWAWDEVLTDAGVGNDTAVAVAQTYLSGWTSEWSRLVELNGLVADDHYNLTPDSAGNQTTLILKAA